MLLRRRMMLDAADTPPSGGPNDWRGMIDRGVGVPYGGTLTSEGWWLPPAYPSEPSPLGSGTRKTAANASELNAILAAGLTAGDVVALTGSSYVNVDWNGGAGTSATQALDSSHNGTSAAPIVFYSATKHGAAVSRTNSTGGGVIIATDANNNHIEWWGVDITSGSSSAAELWFGEGVHLKWCNVSTNANAPAIRHCDTTDSGLWFCDVENSSVTSQAEGHYVGWGTDASLYAQDGMRTIGCTFSDCAGGPLDIKANTTDYLAEFNVIDGLDWQSGIFNCNGGYTNQLTTGQKAGKVPGDMIFRYNVARVERADASNGDVFRVGGPCTIENNIGFAGAGTVEDAIFVFAGGSGDFTIVANDNRFWGMADEYSASTVGALTVTSSGNIGDNNYDEALSGTNVASSYFVGPVTGSAVADATARLGGLGTGFKVDGVSDPYEVS